MRARLEQERREAAYKVYVTDSLQAIPQQKRIVARYEDFIHRTIDTRTADEIVIDVMRRAGLKPKGGE